MSGRITNRHSGVRAFLKPLAVTRTGSLAQFAAVMLVSALVSISSSLYAAPINYGSFMGDTVTYVDVTENSVTDPLPLFGAPTVSGDSIDFNPVGFAAYAENGSSDLTDGQLVFMIQAKPGYGIDNVRLSEAGITTLIGNGTDTTRTDVSAVGSLNIQEVNGVGISTIAIPIDLQFSPNADGQWQLVTDGQVDTQPWTGTQFFNIKQALIDQGKYVGVGATKVSIDLDNGLVAESETGTVALIDKKDFGGVSITVNVPEPGTLALALVALVGVVSRRRVAGRLS